MAQLLHRQLHRLQHVSVVRVLPRQARGPGTSARDPGRRLLPRLQSLNVSTRTTRVLVLHICGIRTTPLSRRRCGRPGFAHLGGGREGVQQREHTVRRAERGGELAHLARQRDVLRRRGARHAVEQRAAVLTAQLGVAARQACGAAGQTGAAAPLPSPPASRSALHVRLARAKQAGAQRSTRHRVPSQWLHTGPGSKAEVLTFEQGRLVGAAWQGCQRRPHRRLRRQLRLHLQAPCR